MCGIFENENEVIIVRDLLGYRRKCVCPRHLNNFRKLERDYFGKDGSDTATSWLKHAVLCFCVKQ